MRANGQRARSGQTIVRVNINLVLTTVQPKGNMQDHIYHGNIKCFCRSNLYIWHIYFFKHTYTSFFDWLSVCLLYDQLLLHISTVKSKRFGRYL